MNLRSTSHLFHLVKPSAWPLLSSFAAFFFASGVAFYMHQVTYGGFVAIFGFICLVYCAFFWLSDIIDEATFTGYHTLVVRKGLRLGFILFIASELCYSLVFFEHFFILHLSRCWIWLYCTSTRYSAYLCFWCTTFNTFILISSGISVTWAHRAMSLGSFKNLIDSLLLTLILGFIFVFYQVQEYKEATFNFSDSVYSCSFYMLTGLHGAHVLAGASMLLVCLIRSLKRHYLTTHYLGFVIAIWYWHFVDIVWIFLFLTIYCWGSW